MNFIGKWGKVPRTLISKAGNDYLWFCLLLLYFALPGSLRFYQLANFTKINSY